MFGFLSVSVSGELLLMPKALSFDSFLEFWKQLLPLSPEFACRLYLMNESLAGERNVQNHVHKSPTRSTYVFICGWLSSSDKVHRIVITASHRRHHES